MTSMKEQKYITNCLLEIEEKLHWGNSSDWAQYDFEKLSTEIEIKTNTLLSVTTLKRLWGKIKYDHAPSLTTLNTLAQYLDYSDWRSYKLSSKPIDSIPFPPNHSKPEVVYQPRKLTDNSNRWQWIGLAFIVLVVCIGIIALTTKEQVVTSAALNPDMFSFTADKVLSIGLPNSVVFHYDATAATSDSIYIVQTWDIRRKTLVDKNKHDHSAIYYYPGYFRAKLLIDSQVVKTHDVQIATDGWLCLIENGDRPLYFDRSDFEKQGLIEIDESTLKKYNIDLLPVSPKIRFFNQNDFGPITNDNFTFETDLKNEHHNGDNACQFVQVLIQCKDDIIIIPLSASSCIGDLHLTVCGANINSKQADMTGFGCDLDQWTHLKVTSEDKLLKIWVNDIEAYSLVFPNTPGGIVGVQYRFNGLGAVKNTFFTHGMERIEL